LFDRKTIYSSLARILSLSSSIYFSHPSYFFLSSNKEVFPSRHLFIYLTLFTYTEELIVEMIDPMQAFDMESFKSKTSSLLVPTSTPSVAPIPTVVPNVPTYETVGESGTKTLWVSFINRLQNPVRSPLLTSEIGCLRYYVLVHSYFRLHGMESPSCKYQAATSNGPFCISLG
jgi:hypothetical protein